MPGPSIRHAAGLAMLAAAGCAAQAHPARGHGSSEVTVAVSQGGFAGVTKREITIRADGEVTVADFLDDSIRGAKCHRRATPGQLRALSEANHLRARMNTTTIGEPASINPSQLVLSMADRRYTINLVPGESLEQARSRLADTSPAADQVLRIAQDLAATIVKTPNAC